MRVRPSRSGSNDREFAHLVEENAPRLLAYFTRRVEPVGDAADLCNETFIVAWRKRSAWPTADENERVMWLYGIAAFVLANHRRGRQRADKLLTALRQSLEQDVDQSADVELRITLQQALHVIDPLSAEIIRLVHWDGFSITDAGAMLKIPASTARSRYAVAKDRLRAELDRDIELVRQPTDADHGPTGGSS